MAYRMLGSAMEAEDIVQEAYLRHRATPPESIRTLKSFLTTIVHHLCLDHLKSAQAQRKTTLVRGCQSRSLRAMARRYSPRCARLQTGSRFRWLFSCCSKAYPRWNVLCFC